MGSQSPYIREAKKDAENFCSKSPSQEVTPLGFKLKSAEILAKRWLFTTFYSASGEETNHQPLWEEGHPLPPTALPLEVLENASGKQSGPGPGVTGRPQLSRSCPRSGGRPGGHAEPEMGCPAPWAPCLLHCGVQLRPARRFPGHATFSIAE